MDVDLSPPQSPFDARPAPASPPPAADKPSSVAESSSTKPPPPPASSEGPTAAKPLPVEWPLTSFSSTPHNVAAIAFVLGATWSVGAVLLALNASSWFAWSSEALKSHVQHLPQGVWYAATHSSQLGFYLACWSFFHLAEFLVTSMYNPGKLSVSCASLFRSLPLGERRADLLARPLDQLTSSTTASSTTSPTSPASSSMSSRTPTFLLSTVGGSMPAASSSSVRLRPLT